MTSKTTRKAQSKTHKTKQAKSFLKRLKSIGLYAGDLRKRVSNYGFNLIAKFEAVLKGDAVVVQPRDPQRFKDIFTVRGNSVIVPKRKGEKITIDKKTGEIVSKRRVGKRTVTARGRQLKRGEKIEKPTAERRVQYVIPFNSTHGVNWVRFPNWDELQKFMAGYNYKGWEDYVVEEDIGDEIDDDELNERLGDKRKGRRIKGGIKKPKPAPTKTKTKSSTKKSRR